SVPPRWAARMCCCGWPPGWSRNTAGRSAGRRFTWQTFHEDASGAPGPDLRTIPVECKKQRQRTNRERQMDRRSFLKATAFTTASIMAWPASSLRANADGKKVLHFGYNAEV